MSHALRVLHESEIKRILHDEHVMHASGISQDSTLHRPFICSEACTPHTLDSSKYFSRTIALAIQCM